MLRRLLHPERSYTSLFDAHPPFQIDGNFGGAAGIIEMLVQSSAQGIRLLSAMPRCWPKGRLRGVRVFGGIEADMSWSNYKITALRLTSRLTQEVEIVIGDQTHTLSLTAGIPMDCVV